MGQVLPSVERCDHLDNDCDGQIDEDFPQKGQPCSAGQGACHRSGTIQCTNDGHAAQCSAKAGPAEQERCDGKDNDCDGQVDEDFPTKGQGCSVGQGVCLARGKVVCGDGGKRAVCDAKPQNDAKSPDLCDGLDNDCDGQVDEDFPKVGTPCSAGVGECQDRKTWRCSDDKKSVACDAKAKPPTPEVCDGLDNDCDGKADERSCYPTNEAGCKRVQGRWECAGICKPGVQVCVKGQWDVCRGHQLPATQELCHDKLDNNCDGKIDDGRCCAPTKLQLLQAARPLILYGVDISPALDELAGRKTIKYTSQNEPRQQYRLGFDPLSQSKSRNYQPHPTVHTQMARYLSDGKTLLVGLSQQMGFTGVVPALESALAVRVSDGKVLYALKGHATYQQYKVANVEHMEVSPNDAYLAMSFTYGNSANLSYRPVVVWRLKDKTIVRQLFAKNRSVFTFAFSPDSKSLAALLYDHTQSKPYALDLYRWRLRDGTLLQSKSSILSTSSIGYQRQMIAYHPNGKQIAVTNGAVIQIWDLASATLLHTLKAPASTPFTTLQFSPSGEWLAALSGYDADLHFWDTTSYKKRHFVPKPPKPSSSYMINPRRLRWSKDSRKLGVVGATHAIVYQCP